jgi:hypothetical protein
LIISLEILMNALKKIVMIWLVTYSISYSVVDLKALSISSFRSLIPISESLGFPCHRDMNTSRFTIKSSIF